MTLAEIRHIYSHYIDNNDYVFGTYKNTIMIMKLVETEITYYKSALYMIIVIFDKTYPHKTYDILNKQIYPINTYLDCGIKIFEKIESAYWTDLLNFNKKYTGQYFTYLPDKNLEYRATYENGKLCKDQIIRKNENIHDEIVWHDTQQSYHDSTYYDPFSYCNVPFVKKYNVSYSQNFSNGEVKCLALCISDDIIDLTFFWKTGNKKKEGAIKVVAGKPEKIGKWSYYFEDGTHRGEMVYHDYSVDEYSDFTYWTNLENQCYKTEEIISIVNGKQTKMTKFKYYYLDGEYKGEMLHKL